MNFQPSDRQRDFVVLAGHLARTQFAPRAAMYDQNASLQLENDADLHQAGDARGGALMQLWTADSMYRAYWL